MYLFQRALLLQKKQTVDAEDAKNMTECYDIVEKYLEGNDWIAGDSMTIADFSYIAMFISLPVSTVQTLVIYYLFIHYLLYSHYFQKTVM